MGILGMMVAGGAQGLANASNQNVAAQQQLEMENIREGRDDRREALRQKYLEKNFNIQRQDRKEMARAQMQLDERNYQRERTDKMADADVSHRQRIELEGIRESGRNSRSANSIAAANARSGSASEEGHRKMQSPEGRAAEDLMRLKLADNERDAFNMAVRLDIVKAAQQNPLTKINDGALLESVERLTEGLFPQKGRGLLNGGTAVPEVSFDLDNKTGRLIPNGR